MTGDVKNPGDAVTVTNFSKEQCTHTPLLKWVAASLSDSVVPAVKKWKHHLIMHAIFFSEYLSLQTFNICQYTLRSAWVHRHIGRMKVLQVRFMPFNKMFNLGNNSNIAIVNSKIFFQALIKKEKYIILTSACTVFSLNLILTSTRAGVCLTWRFCYWVSLAF